MEDEKTGFLLDKGKRITIEECINLLRTDIRKWNSLRASNPDWHPNLNYEIKEEDLKKSGLYEIKPEDLIKHVKDEMFNNTGIDLSMSDLRGANLANATLNSANLSGANLEKADLHESFLMDAKLSHANLRDAKLWTVIAPRSDFSNAIMSGVDLENSLLHNAKLNNCDLSNSNLKGVHFCDKYANGADITGSKLHGIQISAEGDYCFSMLAGTKGLETVDFGDQVFLSEYITKVFDVINQEGQTIFNRNLATKIRSLVPLYLADTIAHTSITESCKLRRRK